MLIVQQGDVRVVRTVLVPPDAGFVQGRDELSLEQLQPRDAIVADQDEGPLVSTFKTHCPIKSHHEGRHRDGRQRLTDRSSGVVR